MKSNLLSTLLATKQHKKIFLGVQELVFVVFGGLFFEFLIFFISRGHNFFIFNLFMMIVNVSNVSRGEI
jgi:hypothetical protein